MFRPCKEPPEQSPLWGACFVLLIILMMVRPWGSVATASELEEVRGLARSGRTYEALGQLEPILAGDPNDIDALLLKGALLVELERVDEAKKIFLALIDSEPELPEPYVNLAALYGAAGDYDRAVAVLKQALETHPSYHAAYESLNKIYGQMASHAYQRALGGEQETAEPPVELALLDRSYSTSIRPLDSPEAVSLEAEERIADTNVAPMTDQLPEEDDSSLAVTLEEQAESPDAMGEETVAIHEDEETEVMAGLGAPAEPPLSLADPAVDPAEEAGKELETIPDLIEAWAAAWSGQRVEEYLGYYSAAFVAMGDLSREDWEMLRRVRLSDPEYISVSFEDLEISDTGAGTAMARFVQSYESNVLSDLCVKVLGLVWEEEEWRIASERIEE